MQLAIRDSNQGPFFSKVLRQAQEQQQLSNAELAQIKSKAVLMSLKFADKFYNKYKMHLLEQAAHDVIGVISLGLAELSGQDMQKALQLLTSPDSVMKPFQKGWSMLVTVSSKQPNRKSLFGEVDEQLLNDISSPPDAEEWQGWQIYQNALLEANRRNAITVLKQQFFQQTVLDPFEHFNLEAMLAEVVIYRVVCGHSKVKQDLKQRIRQVELQDRWFDVAYLQLQTEVALAELPPGISEAIRPDIGQNFAQALLKTLNFAVKYREKALANASPEQLDAFEHKQGMQNPLLGWPQYIEM
ncbi:cold adaptation protein AtcC [Rheinheimera sp.]|uniref:cold adaptation protein AtcC n=1 Tax=Rheinheimera sp. TaxID=1869214 RepID=UPI002FDE07DC